MLQAEVRHASETTLLRDSLRKASALLHEQKETSFREGYDAAMADAARTLEQAHSVQQAAVYRVLRTMLEHQAGRTSFVDAQDYAHVRDLAPSPPRSNSPPLVHLTSVQPPTPSETRAVEANDQAAVIRSPNPQEIDSSLQVDQPDIILSRAAPASRLRSPSHAEPSVTAER